MNLNMIPGAYFGLLPVLWATTLSVLASDGQPTGGSGNSLPFGSYWVKPLLMAQLKQEMFGLSIGDFLPWLLGLENGRDEHASFWQPIPQPSTVP